MEIILIVVYFLYSGGLLLAQLRNSLYGSADPVRQERRKNILDIFLRTGSMGTLPLIWIYFAEPVMAPWKLAAWILSVGLLEICRFFVTVYAQYRQAPDKPGLDKTVIREIRNVLLTLLVILAAGLAYFIWQNGGIG